jgi:hypothetical protein
MIGNSFRTESCHVSSAADNSSPRPTIWFGNNTIADIQYCFGVPQVFVGDQLWRNAQMIRECSPPCNPADLSYVDPNATITLMDDLSLQFMSLQIGAGARILFYDNTTSLKLFRVRLVMMPGSSLGAPSTTSSTNGRLFLCGWLELADPSVFLFLLAPLTPKLESTSRLIG